MGVPAISNFPFVSSMESECSLLLQVLHGLFPHSLLSMSFPGFLEDEALLVTWLDGVASVQGTRFSFCLS